MTELPKGWVSSRLADVADVRLGRQRSPKNATGDRMRPYLRAANVKWSGLDLSDVNEMAFTATESLTYELRPGDLLLGEASGSPSEVGKPGQYKGEIEGCCFQNTLLRVRLPDGLLPDFYEHYFREQALNGRFAAGSRGVGIRHLGAAALSDWTIPIPSSAEQERIVLAIEEAFSKLDAGEAGLRRVRRLLSAQRRAAILQSIPSPLPASWQQVTVADAGRVQLGRQRHPDWHTGPQMRAYLRVANVFEARIDPADLHEMHFDDETFERYQLRPGDVLLNEGQSPHLVGRPALYEGSPADVAFTKSLMRFQPGPGVEPSWALLVFRHHLHSGRFKREARITTNIAHLPVVRLKPIEFPIPPFEEQARIVAEVERQLSFIDACERSIDAGLALSDGLRRSVLKAAFKGRLVPQDSSDEPASVLLDRIRAERVGQSVSKRRARQTA